MNPLPSLAKVSVLLLLLLIPKAVTAGMPSMKLEARVMLEPARLAAVCSAANTGEETVYNVSITSSLANDTRRSDPLGDIHAGKHRNQRVEFSLEGLKPGRYILVTRLDFHEQNGLPHRVHSFHAFRLVRKEPEVQEAQETLEERTVSVTSGMAEMPGLSVSEGMPAVQWRAFGTSGATLSLMLKNLRHIPVQPVISLYLPDGVAADREEMRVEMGPGEERREEIPLRADRSIRGGHPVSVLIRYETSSEHDSRLLRTTLAVEENPASITGIAVAATIFLIAVSATAFLFFRRRSAGADGKSGT
ncbi:MAG: hypothetical protein HPY65_07580 [Syntrophaceae bacterium]|nr:hypothetical protein [Syntrophaceae bacterium]